MASPLESQISRAIYAGFRGKLFKGVLRRQENAVSGGLDTLGDALEASPVDYTLEGFREAYSRFTRASAGIPETDVRILILAQSVSVRPQKGDRIWLFKDPIPGWWQVRGPVESDPATATYECQSFQVQGIAP